MTLETQSEVEAKLKRNGLCAAACDNISNEHLELIVSAGGFSQMATHRLVQDRNALLAVLKQMTNALRDKTGETMPNVVVALTTIASIESNSPMVGSVSEWQAIETAPKDKKLLGLVDGEVRFIRYGKASHVPLYGFCLADQGAEDFDLCEPDGWMPTPEIKK